MASQPPPHDTARGFLGSLFDIDFTSLIISRIIKVVYVIAIVLIALEALGVIVAALASKNVGAIIAAVIIAPIAALFSLIWIRILLELVIIIFRIGEDVRRISLSPAISVDGGAAVAPVEQAVAAYPSSGPVPTMSGGVAVAAQRTATDTESTGEPRTVVAVPLVHEPLAHEAAAESYGVDQKSQSHEPAQTAPSSDLPQAGWYHDPQHADMLRFWDGEAWTDQRRPVPPS
jgi:Domain of unknown function (DUF4282)/Protein of unknown function (DUF2510)